MKCKYLLPIVWSFFIVAAAPKPDITGTIISVGDGDTVRIDTGDRRITVRLSCIDAPEISQQPWGIAARDELRKLLPIGQQVRVRQFTVDRYKRVVGEVFSSSPSPVNLEMVRSGYSVVYIQYLRGCDRASYLNAEKQARESKLNFWSQDNPVMPWNYRATRKRNYLEK